MNNKDYYTIPCVGTIIYCNNKSIFRLSKKDLFDVRFYFGMFKKFNDFSYIEDIYEIFIYFSKQETFINNYQKNKSITIEFGKTKIWFDLI